MPDERLPETTAGFDVALMPFALNEATLSISPAKPVSTSQRGLPVVSTRVPDVVADYRGVVHLADDGPGFAAACRQVVQHSADDPDRRWRSLKTRYEWTTSPSVWRHCWIERSRPVPPTVGVRVTAPTPDRPPAARTPARAAAELEQAHRHGVGAAIARGDLCSCSRTAAGPRS